MANKRAHGEGSIYERRGTFVVTVPFPQPDGTTKRVERTVRIEGETDKAKREAERKAERTRRDLITLRDEGNLAGSDRLTVSGALDIWIESWGGLAPKTKRTYEQITRLYLRPKLGERLLSKLTPLDVTRFLQTLKDEEIGESTIRHCKQYLSTAISDAVQNGLVTRNVVQSARMPKFAPKTNQTLQKIKDLELVADTSKKQSQLLLKTIMPHTSPDSDLPPLGNLFIVLMSLGLRFGEALGITWDAISYDKGVPVSVTVAKQLAELPKGEYVLAPTKTHNTKTIPLPEFVGDALLRQRQWQDRVGIEAGWDATNNSLDLVFTSTLATPISQSNARRWWKRVLENAGVPYINPHATRHICASMLLTEKVPLPVVAKILGHEDPATTARMYAHVLQGEMGAALSAMQSVAED